MEYEWDETKFEFNLLHHKIAFSAVEKMNWSEVVVIDRSRHKDGEARYAGIGMLDGKPHTVIFTWREDRMRIISFRRANTAEEKIYAQKP